MGHVAVERIMVLMGGVEDVLLDFIAAVIKGIQCITMLIMGQRILGPQATIQMALVNGTISHDQ